MLAFFKTCVYPAAGKSQQEQVVGVFHVARRHTSAQ